MKLIYCKSTILGLKKKKQKNLCQVHLSLSLPPQHSLVIQAMMTFYPSCCNSLLIISRPFTHQQNIGRSHHSSVNPENENNPLRPHGLLQGPAVLSPPPSAPALHTPPARPATGVLLAFVTRSNRAFAHTLPAELVLPSPSSLPTYLCIQSL